jgi:hypothetical protein
MHSTKVELLPFQSRVQPWVMACFGEMIAGDREERNHRFLEEALELVQACGCTASEAHQLVDYVYSRDVGDPPQEVGGVMVTLAALCLANGLDMHANGEAELARIWTKVDAIRAKQAAKPKHSPLPMHTRSTPIVDVTRVEKLREAYKQAAYIARRFAEEVNEDGVIMHNPSAISAGNEICHRILKAAAALDGTRVDAGETEAEVRRIMAMSDDEVLAEATADDAAWARGFKRGLKTGSVVADAKSSDTCATCSFPWGADPVRHAEFCDARILASTGEGLTSGEWPALRSIYDVLHAIYDTCEDEGDRIYLGSTNDHHTLKRQLRRLEKLIPQRELYPDAASPSQPTNASVREALDWFSTQRRLSLDFHAPMYGDDDDQNEEWRVSLESGPINDREWDIVGRGKSAAEAILAARAAISTPLVSGEGGE